MGTQKWIYSLAGAASAESQTLWAPWTDKDMQPSGFVSAFPNNVTFVTVRGAGLEIGQFQPQRLHLVFSSFVAGAGGGGSGGATVDATLLTALVATAGTFLFLVVLAGGVFIHYSKSATAKARAREVVDGSAGTDDADDVNSTRRGEISLTDISLKPVESKIGN